MSSVSVEVEVEEGDMVAIFSDELDEVFYEVEGFGSIGTVYLRCESTGKLEILYRDEFREVVEDARFFSVERY